MNEVNPFSNYRYNPFLRKNANLLRKDMTKAEACLWKFVLRARQMKGYTFNRQRPVLKYIADFLCKELSLIIEVDGITHDDEKVMDKDKRRQLALENAGFIVIRFSDNEILHHIRGVREMIEDIVDEVEKKKKE
jgi:very-short-patch-repair endonuclease